MVKTKVQSCKCIFVYWPDSIKNFILSTFAGMWIYTRFQTDYYSKEGNCDAELVLKVVSDFYTQSCSSCMLLTGDGDFGCLVEFLKEHKAINGVLSPDHKKCSILLRNKNTEITFLNNHYHKFSTKIRKEKAPDADVSA
jgi:uncharacterized LabA/DUF88 family protein